MTTLIDWHSHHTPRPLAERIEQFTGRYPRIDAEDSGDFTSRIAEMDDAGVEFQLVSQGNGIHGSRPDAAGAMEMARACNDFVAESVAPFPDRLFGTVAVTFLDVEGSVGELQRMADRGFRAVILYAQGEMIGQPDAEPVFAKIAELGLPIFLHGGGSGGYRGPSMEHLEDGGQGLGVVHTDAAVADYVVRMIAAGLFDRYPALQIVIRTGGGSVPSLLGKLRSKHKGPEGEQRYSEVLREHFLVDTSGADAITLQYLIDRMGEERVVFGSDFCGGLGPMRNALRGIEAHRDPQGVSALTRRNSDRLLRL